MTEREYLRLKAQIEADYRKRLDALELVWKMARQEAPSCIAAPAQKTTDLTPAIRAVLPAIPAIFSIRDVVPKIGESVGVAVNRSSLSSALKRLADAKELEVVEVGIGRKPTIYRKAA